MHSLERYYFVKEFGSAVGFFDPIIFTRDVRAKGGRERELVERGSAS